jgi:formate dehydrogenase maturation protein FdhE
MPKEAEGLSFVKETFISSEMSCPDFLRLIFRNREDEIMRLIRHYGLRQDLATFFAVYFARPYRAAAARILKQGVDMTKWKRGYCPIDGHWPALSHVNAESDARHLWCRHCGTTWAHRREHCPFCGSTRYRTVEIIAPGSEEPYRAQACNECRRYVKEVRTDLDVINFPFDAAYFQTLALDEAMQQEGYLLDSPLILSDEIQHACMETV